jgi:hypothetical protein
MKKARAGRAFQSILALAYFIGGAVITPAVELDAGAAIGMRVSA